MNNQNKILDRLEILESLPDSCEEDKSAKRVELQQQAYVEAASRFTNLISLVDAEIEGDSDKDLLIFNNQALDDFTKHVINGKL